MAGEDGRDEKVILHWVITVPMNIFKYYTQMYLKCKLNENPVHRAESLVLMFIVAIYVFK